MGGVAVDDRERVGRAIGLQNIAVEYLSAVRGRGRTSWPAYRKRCRRIWIRGVGDGGGNRGAEALTPDPVTVRATLGNRILAPTDVVARIHNAVAIEIGAAE